MLGAAGVESEADLPFAGLAELCADALELIGRLPGPQARALDGALARREAVTADRFAIGAALLSLFALAGDGGPVLVGVDDAQWLDAASADALLFAARRLRRESVAMLVATRPDTAFDDPRSGLERVELRGLDRPAALAVLRTVHGALPDRVAASLAERSEGNPLALLELPRLLSEAELAGDEPIGEPFPLGPSLVRALLRRQAGLPAATRRALVVAAAGSDERVQPVLEALAARRLGHDALEPAERAGVLTVAGTRLTFCHPLLRSAIYHGATAPARRAAHAALAAVSDGESRAWHLAQATVGEDEAVAATLEHAGLDARRRGAHAAAASALAHAARLSAAGAPRLRRLTEAARDAHLAGRPSRALRLLDDALAGGPDAIQRADVQRLRGGVLLLQGRTGDAYRVLVDEAARVRPLDSARAATMLGEACLHRLLGADPRGALAAARDACRAAADAGPDVQAYTAAMLASALVLTGARPEATAVLDGVLPALRRADPLTAAGELLAVTAQCYFWLDRWDVAAELLAGLIASARRASVPAALLLPLSCRAELDLRAGRWTVAEAQLDEAARLGEEMAHPVFATYALECLARLAAAAGDHARCRDQAARALAMIDDHHNEIGRLYVHSALGLLELGLGRIAEAITALEAARALAERHGVAEPNIVHWQGDLVEAYARAGRPDAAEAALVALERQARHTNGTWALGVAARCRGLLGGSDDGFDAAAGHLGAMPFELARTHLCRGERLRRAGQRSEARRSLQLAMEGFDALGAHPWTARAQAELRASGGHPRPRRGADPDRLTAHELQVALVVAQGATNREAAAALFLSPKTIEFHLAHIYRKLGVRTRTQLAGVAARRGWLDGER